MKLLKKILQFVLPCTIFLLLASCDGLKWSEHQVDSFMLVEQRGGPTLGYSPASGVKLLTIDGYALRPQSQRLARCL